MKVHMIRQQKTNVSNQRDLEMGDQSSNLNPNVTRPGGKSLAGSRSFNHISMRPSCDPDDVTPPCTPKVIKSNAGKALAVSTSAKSLGGSNSSKSLVAPGSSKSFSISGSGKRMDQRRMYVKQVTGKHKDTELHLAADKGDVEAVMEILREIEAQMMGTVTGVEFDAELADIRLAIINELNELGETPLFQAAEKGHLEIVKALLPHMTSNGIFAKNQVGFNALHVAASQGHEDPSIVMLLDKFGNAPLHVATRKKRVEIVNELLVLPHTNVNALTRDRKTALDIAEALPLSEEIVEIKDSLTRYGALKASDLNQPRDELRKTVTEIQKDVHSQLEQARRTNQNVTGIAKELKRLHREGINNATNSVTVVAVLFATVAFAAIFTVPLFESPMSSIQLYKRLYPKMWSRYIQKMDAEHHKI